MASRVPTRVSAAHALYQSRTGSSARSDVRHGVTRVKDERLRRMVELNSAEGDLRTALVRLLGPTVSGARAFSKFRQCTAAAGETRSSSSNAGIIAFDEFRRGVAVAGLAWTIGVARSVFDRIGGGGAATAGAISAGKPPRGRQQRPYGGLGLGDNGGGREDTPRHRAESDLSSQIARNVARALRVVRSAALRLRARAHLRASPNETRQERPSARVSGKARRANARLQPAVAAAEERIRSRTPPPSAGGALLPYVDGAAPARERKSMGDLYEACDAAATAAPLAVAADPQPSPTQSGADSVAADGAAAAELAEADALEQLVRLLESLLCPDPRRRPDAIVTASAMKLMTPAAVVAAQAAPPPLVGAAAPAPPPPLVGGGDSGGRAAGGVSPASRAHPPKRRPGRCQQPAQNLSCDAGTSMAHAVMVAPTA